MTKATVPVLYSGIVDDIIESGNTEKYNRIERAIDESHVSVATVDSLHIIYVIGESCIKERLSLFGYFLNTTPNILNEYKKGNVVTFNKVITSSPRTIDMFPKLMAVADIDDGIEDVDHPLLPALLKKGGYYVQYFDNQTVKRDIKRFDFGCSSFISKPSILRKSVDETNDYTKQYDLDFVQDNPINFEHNRTFSIYHIMGQHNSPADRYPMERAKFVPDDYIHINQLNEEMRNDMASYDNAILEMDSTIQFLIEQIKDKNSVLIFVPDHGEEMYDSRPKKFRDIDSHTPAVLRVIYNIPAFIWLSDKYMSMNNEIKHRLQSNSNKKIYNSDIPFTILDFSTITTPFIDRRYSLLNSHQGRTKRFIRGNFNYDAVESDIDSIKLYYQQNL